MTQISPNEFERLCKNIENTVSKLTDLADRSLNTAASSIGDSFDKASEKFNEKGSAFAESVTNWSRNKNTSKVVSRPSDPTNSIVKLRFRSSAPYTASGVALGVLGAVGLLSFSTLFIVFLAGLFTFLGMLYLPATITFGVLAAGSGAVLGWGMKNYGTGKALKRFRQIFGTREAVTLQELSERSQMTERKTLKEARKLIKKGLLPQGHIDDESTTLMVTNGAYSQYRQTEQWLKEQREKQAAEEEARRKAAEKRSQVPVSASVKKFLEDAQSSLDEIRQLGSLINTGEIQEKLSALEAILEQIIARVEEQPELMDGLERLTAYYLPTTVDLLRAYVELEDQPIQGQQIKKSRQEIEQTLDTLIKAYQKMLDDTYRDLSMNISADISVLHAVLAQEGLTQGPFDMPTDPQSK